MSYYFIKYILIRPGIDDTKISVSYVIITNI